jgi:hypothetical protein
LKAATNDVHASISGDITMIFQNKSSAELATLEEQMRKKLQGGNVDVEYWETLLSKLQLFKARATIDEIYMNVVKPSEWQQWTVVQPPQPTQEKRPRTWLNPNRIIPTNAVIPQPGAQATGLATSSSMIQLNSTVSSSSTSSSSSLPSLSSSSTTSTTTASGATKLPPPPASMDIELRRRQLEKEMAQIRSNKFVLGDERVFSADELYQREADNGLDENEQLITDEQVQQPTFEWAGKHRAIKPRFWCKLRRIPNWNRYNQTHYDLNNPPPRIIDGYRFNVRDTVGDGVQ